jgi:hypothetical protein
MNGLVYGFALDQMMPDYDVFARPAETGALNVAADTACPAGVR